MGTVQWNNETNSKSDTLCYCCWFWILHSWSILIMSSRLRLGMGDRDVNIYVTLRRSEDSWDWQMLELKSRSQHFIFLILTRFQLVWSIVQVTRSPKHALNSQTHVDWCFSTNKWQCFVTICILFFFTYFLCCCFFAFNNHKQMSSIWNEGVIIWHWKKQFWSTSLKKKRKKRKWKKNGALSFLQEVNQVSRLVLLLSYCEVIGKDKLVAPWHRREGEQCLFLWDKVMLNYSPNASMGAKEVTVTHLFSWCGATRVQIRFPNESLWAA